MRLTVKKLTGQEEQALPGGDIVWEFQLEGRFQPCKHDIKVIDLTQIFILIFYLLIMQMVLEVNPFATLTVD